jgi:GGDEF domain-containing protein
MRKEFGKQAVESGLRSVASVLKSSFRPTDVVARIGESQFAALAVDAIEPSGPVLRQRVEKRFAALHRDVVTEGSLELRISMGFWPTEGPKPFSEFLDSVEAGLRAAPLVSEEHAVPRTVAPQR